jgi:gamma-glutamylcyclotransferase (GGCT)/AIG2-like uncharacterized protein YtfP
LFVYGTLRAGQPNNYMLDGIAKHVGIGTVSGALYQILPYSHPGVIELDEAGTDQSPITTTGDVYEFLPLFEKKALEEMDVFERRFGYERRPIVVSLEGEDVEAFIYGYERPVSPKAFIPHGDYSRWVAWRS